MSTPTDPIDCGALRAHVETLSVALGEWSYRDDSKPQPEVRQAANVAVESLDAALAELHRIRGRFVVEIRQFDDAAMRRAEALLANLYAERDERPDGAPGKPAVVIIAPDDPERAR